MARNSRLKDHYAEQRMFGRRVMAASIVVMLLVGALFARLFYLQVVRHEYFAELSQGNRIRIEPIPPPRGLILDRKGEPLALNRPAYQLEVTREQTPDLDATLAGLVDLGLLPAEDLARTKRTIMARRVFEAVPIRLQLSELELARFAVHRPDFPGVEIRPRLTRMYPHGGVGVHALGYVGAISEQDQERIDVSKYLGTTLIGKLGIERNYEDVLHGETGYQQLLVNAQGRRVDRVGLKAPDLQRREPVAGDDLILTIDHKLQEASEAALGTQRAAVVAIDPHNGDILAFVSTPTFDPNGFARGLTVPEYRALADNPDKPLIDRALRGVYPPGSTIKPFVALAALQYGVTHPQDVRLCRGAWQFPGSSHRYRDWKKTGHGSVDMHKAIAQSCDTYFYAVSDQIGIDRFHDFLVEFGFSNKVGIDILGERTGLVPSRAWKKKAFKKKELQVGDRWHGRRDAAGRHGLPLADWREVPDRGQDRHGAGVLDRPEREVQRGRDRRTTA
jgi:penicillin-binding protein 2